MWEYLLFAGLMFVGMLILLLQASRYKYVTLSDKKEDPKL